MSHQITPFKVWAYCNPSRGDMDEAPETCSRLVTCPVGSALDLDDLHVDELFVSTVFGQQEAPPLALERHINSLTNITEQKIFKPVTINKVYTTQERIEQVQKGAHILLCIHSSQKPTNFSMELQNEKGQVEFTLQNNFKKLEDGSLEMINKWLLKKQKQVLGYLLKQFGSVIVSGKSIMSISLPITIFEPRSLLERIADCFVFAPHFLEKGGQSTDTMEQFRCALAFYLSTLAADLNPEKPFNPVLGETFQGLIGGCEFYAEQICHHPPMSSFQMYGKNFRIEGCFGFNANISANSVKYRKVGDCKVVFPNTGTVIQVQFPTGNMNGTSFGKRCWQYTKKLQVYDFKNNYYTEVDFDKNEGGKKRKEMPGYFLSSIYKTTEKFSNKTRQEIQKQRDVEIKFKEKDHSTAKLDRIEGSWLETLSINDKVYWSTGNPWPYKLQYVANPLPSDSNFRVDLLHLKMGDEIKAQDFKVITEEAQRKDKKLREQTKSKHYK